MSQPISASSSIEPKNFDYKNANISFTHSENNTQGIIDIKNCNASKSFDFDFNLKPGERLVTARQFLGKEFDTGEVFVLNEHNYITKIIDKPWAIDSQGKAIPTYFKVYRNTLSQVVEHSCKDTFPITADPNAWQITMCATAISMVLVGTLIPAAKILKIKKAIKIVGGLSVFAELVIAIITGAKDIAAITTTLGPIVVEAIQMLLGIDTIFAKCKF